MTLPEFKNFPKIPRLNREWIVTEKIDGTNACIHVGDDGTVTPGSRNRWITPGKTTDNYGFAAWAKNNEDELRKLGPGYHYGEWWGSGIARRYGLTEKRWSLFNVYLWSDDAVRPKCCHVVPILGRGPYIMGLVGEATELLRVHGSVAAPGFMDPEGVVAFHTAGEHLYKVTLKNDETRKSAVDGPDGTTVIVQS